MKVMTGVHSTRNSFYVHMRLKASFLPREIRPQQNAKAQSPQLTSNRVHLAWTVAARKSQQTTHLTEPLTMGEPPEAGRGAW